MEIRVIQIYADKIWSAQNRDPSVMSYKFWEMMFYGLMGIMSALPALTPRERARCAQPDTAVVTMSTVEERQPEVRRAEFVFRRCGCRTNSARRVPDLRLPQGR